MKEEIRKSLEDISPVRCALAGGQNECDAFVGEAHLGTVAEFWMGEKKKDR